MLVESVVRELGGIDILLNNAGIIRRAPLLELSEKDWDDVIQLNESAVFFLSQAVARQMVSQGRGGKIINIASMLSFQGGIHAGGGWRLALPIIWCIGCKPPFRPMSPTFPKSANPAEVVGRAPGPRGTPSSRSPRGTKSFRPEEAGQGSAADAGVRPTIYAGVRFRKLSGIGLQSAGQAHSDCPISEGPL